MALLFAVLGFLLGVFDLSFLAAFPQRIFGTMTNEVVIAVPLFVFMGVMLERSKVAEELLETMGRMFGRLRGGLGIFRLRRRGIACCIDRESSAQPL